MRAVLRDWRVLAFALLRGAPGHETGNTENGQKQALQQNENSRQQSACLPGAQRVQVIGAPVDPRSVHRIVGADDSACGRVDGDPARARPRGAIGLAKLQ